MAIKQSYLHQNGKIIRHNGESWRLIVARLGGTELVDAECISGKASQGQIINLKTSRNEVAKALRFAAQNNLVH